MVNDHMGVGPMLVAMTIVLMVVAWFSRTRFWLCMTAVRNDGRGTAVFGVKRASGRSPRLSRSGPGSPVVAGAIYAHQFN